ncbi:hypothetical protein [Campylobacter jejuni]|uniref:Uncharacterized protein n=1 Tax=Campylobacter jejuni TaxID=197 RepID=A0A431E7C8_CAMJU|nr:hypothetical protein [Campylobacter jejuni]RTJ77266.1 hypothetical protein C3H57_10280 [Campylobacter jejuni]
MLLAFLIYLAEVSGSIKHVSGWFIVLLIFSICVFAIYTMVSDDEDNRKGMEFGKRVLKCLSIALILSMIVNIVIPKSSTVYLMAGAYMGTEVAKSPDISEKLSKINKIIDYKLNDLLDELKEKSEAKSSKSED